MADEIGKVGKLVAAAGSAARRPSGDTATPSTSAGFGGISTTVAPNDSGPASLPKYGSNPQFIFQSNQINSWLTDAYGVSAGDATLFTNYWAEGFWAENGRWPTTNDIDQDFVVGALGMVTALPPVFSYNGQTYSTMRGLPTPIDNPVQTGPSFILAQQFGGSGDMSLALNAPELTEADIQQMIAATRPARGGGGGRRDPVLDKAQIAEQINEGYRYYLLDEAPDAAALAERFQAEYIAFARQGGNLDLSTWILGQVRQAPKYQSMYARKPPELSEADFINQYRGVANRFGTPTSITTANIQSGMSSGASVAGFSERVENSRPVQVASGNFGRQVANLMNQMRVMK